MGNIHKASSPNQYTKISNVLIRNKDINDGAFRLICWVLSHNDGFSVSFTSINKALGYGRDKLRAILKNAEENNYLVRLRVNGEHGQFDWDYYIFSEPAEAIAFKEVRGISPCGANPSMVDTNHVGQNRSMVQPSMAEPYDGFSTPHKKNNIDKKKKVEEEQQRETPLTPQGEPRAEDSLCSQGEVIQNLSPSDNQTEDFGKPDNLSLKQEVSQPALKSSARDEQVYSAFYEVYLAEKPSNFVEHKALTAVAKKKVKSLVKEFGDKSQDKFIAALIYVREQKDGWWRQQAFSLDNLMSNGKVESFADKHEWSMENDQTYKDRVEGKAPSMDAGRNQITGLKETSDATKPSNALDFSTWMEHQHDIVYRQDYLKSASLEEFYKKRSYLREWYEYAKANCNYEWKLG